MKTTCTLIFLASLALAFPMKVSRAQANDDSSKKPNILVDDDKAQCPTDRKSVV